MSRISAHSADPERSLDVWKTIVGVQQHFNDIGWRIRSLAMTALTFTLGAAFLGYLNADPLPFGALSFSPGAFVPVLGLMIWLLFWFADGIWYHRLLKGAQLAANSMEESLSAQGVFTTLSTEITRASNAKWGPFQKMDSVRKLNLFYGAGAAILCLVAIGITLLTLEIHTACTASAI
ncbi:hypothetical protein ASD19_07370 [Microbacterium sp. Root53]|uniref:hypothetical protein n=1 Tax=Microbacterium sp. Root53 TaxID=1736553 RepID=UPI0006F3A448|nr:hypothetical protein [Microbacterium sp. Root53]KQY98639.1 hypothetical protein ASD19_07370 [Microbacterium sp. Root53]